MKISLILYFPKYYFQVQISENQLNAISINDSQNQLQKIGSGQNNAQAAHCFLGSKIVIFDRPIQIVILHDIVDGHATNSHKSKKSNDCNSQILE